MQNRGYNLRHQVISKSLPMPAQNYDELTNFGKRLSSLRKAAGYTQVELAKELEVTQRMISYYEGQTEFPPSSLMPKLSQLLSVSSDELLGIKPLKKNKLPDTRLIRRVQKIDKLEATKKKQLFQIIDTFIEADQLRQRN